MAYQSDSISTVINRLNTQYFLPAIQREFVWQPEQIIQLFDSIMRGYPISSFLFWELRPENRDKWEIYKFIENFQQNGTHNETANTNGVHQLMLVLDGQQRLTSLLIGLRGTYKTKKKYMHWGNPNAWVKQRLYIDLLQDPKLGDGDGDISNRYGFVFAETPPTSDGKQFWFKVGRILDFESEDAFGDFVYSERDRLPDDVTKGMLTVFEKNLRRLYQAVWKDTIVSYYTEHDQDYDRVLDIFVRANEGGTKLSKSDLLLSMVTLKWSGVNAREEIYRCVDRVNNELTRKNDLDKDFVMKTCLVLSDLGVTYKVENFNKQNLMLIQQNWDGIKSAIERGVDLVNTFGIDRDTLTSANALIPIIYYLYKTPTTHLQGSTQFDRDNATAIRRWLIVSLLNNVFGRASDGVLTETRRVLREQLALSPNFPIDALNSEIGKPSKSPYLDEFALDTFLSMTYGKQTTFLALSLLYDDNAWGTMVYHQDHIFPQSLFRKKRLVAAGLTDVQQAQYLELSNNIANLQFLLAPENIGKSDDTIDHWLTTRDAGFRARHLLPAADDLLRFERFPEFIEARQELIKQRLKALFP